MPPPTTDRICNCNITSIVIQKMEELSWWNWFSELEMNEEHFLRDILQQQQQQQPEEATAFDKSSSIISQQYASSEKHASSSSPSSYIQPFDESTVFLPTTIHDHSCSAANGKEVGSQISQLGSHGTDSCSPLSSSRENKLRRKKGPRSASEALEHIMVERKRRPELNEKFIALSATIPGLKKMDKANVLNEAINYVKQLQERVRELEEDIQKSVVESVRTITRSHVCIDEGTAFCETNSNEWYRTNEALLPEVEARVLGKEVLIKIQCGKQKGIMLNILSQLDRLHLSIARSNILPFGNTLDITIIAQMGDNYSMTLKDLVKSLRLAAMLKG